MEHMIKKVIFYRTEIKEICSIGSIPQFLIEISNCEIEAKTFICSRYVTYQINHKHIEAAHINNAKN